MARKAKPKSAGVLTPVAEFVRLAGSKQAARHVLHVGDPMISDLISGKREASADMMAAIESYKRTQDKPQQGPAVPEFVKWDGTRRSVTSRPLNGKKQGVTTKNVPTPVADLVEKFEGNMAASGRAMGVTGGAVRSLVLGDSTFSDKWQRRVHAALHGTPSLGSDTGDEPDLYALGLAVVQVQTKNYDRVNDVADLLNGRPVFRTHTPSGWLVIYHMKAEEARKFKRIAARDCNKIVCP